MCTGSYGWQNFGLGNNFLKCQTIRIGGLRNFTVFVSIMDKAERVHLGLWS